MIIRVGEGQTSTGKILDRFTRWYTYNKNDGIDERKEAIEYAVDTGRRIYISGNNKKYRETNPGKLMNM